MTPYQKRYWRVFFAKLLIWTELILVVVAIFCIFYMIYQLSFNL
jgi:hypothetical protein